MLQNAPTLAIRGLDTAENGPSKVRQVTNKVNRNIGHLRPAPCDRRSGGRDRPERFSRAGHDNAAGARGPREAQHAPRGRFRRLHRRLHAPLLGPAPAGPEAAPGLERDPKLKIE